MKKVILTLTSLLVIFSAASHAELTNYYVKQIQSKDYTTINMNKSAENSFKTEILNIDSHVTNK